jgi:hypothetical protein
VFTLLDASSVATEARPFESIMHPRRANPRDGSVVPTTRVMSTYTSTILC